MGSPEDEGPASGGVKRSRTVSAVREGPFSKSARRGAPPFSSLPTPDDASYPPEMGPTRRRNSSTRVFRNDASCVVEMPDMNSAFCVCASRQRLLSHTERLDCIQSTSPPHERTSAAMLPRTPTSTRSRAPRPLGPNRWWGCSRIFPEVYYPVKAMGGVYALRAFCYR